MILFHQSWYKPSIKILQKLLTSMGNKTQKGLAVASIEIWDVIPLPTTKLSVKCSNMFKICYKKPIYTRHKTFFQTGKIQCKLPPCK